MPLEQLIKISQKEQEFVVDNIFYLSFIPMYSVRIVTILTVILMNRSLLFAQLAPNDFAIIPDAKKSDAETLKDVQSVGAS